MEIVNMFLISSLQSLAIKEPQLINNMRFYKKLEYTKPVKIHTDFSGGGNYPRVVKSIYDIDFYYHDKEYKVKANQYILFSCEVRHGVLSDKSEFDLYLSEFNLNKNNKKLLDTLIFI